MTELIVPPSKVNLAECDIEEWLYQNPGELSTSMGKIEKWIARQLVIPSGRIDLLGMISSSFPHLVIVEVKNVEFSTDALCQVARYAGDLLDIEGNLTNWENDYIGKLLIAKGQPTNDIQFAADAMDIELHSFDVHYSLSVSGAWNWQKEARDSHAKMIYDLSHNEMFSFLKPKPENATEVDPE